MDRLRKTVVALLACAVIAGFGVAALQTEAGAVDVWSDACSGDAADTAICKEDKPIEDYIQTIVNTLLYVLGAVSVIVIIIAGIYYTTSGGDASLIKRAKDTLLYAVIGLIVAIMAYAIVNFVIGVF